MFGSIGGPELVLILVLALVLFGPRNLPKIGRAIGKAMAEFRGVTHEFRSSLEREVELDELRRTQREIGDVQQELGDSVREAASVPRGTIAAPSEPPAEPERKPAPEISRDGSADQVGSGTTKSVTHDGAGGEQP